MNELHNSPAREEVSCIQCGSLLPAGVAADSCPLCLLRLGLTDLAEEIDEEIVDVVGVTRDEFIVHVHQGQDLGLYSNHNFGENGEVM